MLCSNCRARNPDTSKFCLRCGNRIGLMCTTCRINLPAEAKFCNQCGAAAGAPSEARGPEPLATLKRGESIDLTRIVEQFENRLIDAALQATQGNRNRAAELLGIKRTTLIAKLRRTSKQD